MTFQTMVYCKAGRARVQHTGGRAHNLLFSTSDVFFFLFFPEKLISAPHLLFCSMFFVLHALCLKPTLALSLHSLCNNDAICFLNVGNVLKQFK